MGLLDGFEKLINEHGSATILKERIALANDKYAVLEVEVKSLRSENEILRLDNSQLKVKARNLEEELAERHGHRLEEFRENILLFLAQHDGITDTKIANHAGVAKQLAVFHLEELKLSKLASFEHGISDDFMSVNVWSISQDGRRYLVSHGLL